MAKEEEQAEKKIEEKEERKAEEKAVAPKEEKSLEAEIKEDLKARPKPEEKAWREFTIPLRKKFGKTARYKRAPRAIKTIKEFLLRHMKVYERDLKKIKLDKYLNEFIWTRGIKNPPSKIKVKAIAEGDLIRAELIELTEKLKFRKTKLEKRETGAAAVPKKKVAEEKEVLAKTEEEKEEEKEKKASVVEAGQKLEKAAAKQAKQQAKVSKQPKHQRRMALAK